jgi:hypothetical protein
MLWISVWMKSCKQTLNPISTAFLLNWLFFVQFNYYINNKELGTLYRLSVKSLSFRADIPLRGMTTVNKTFSVEDPATKSQHGELPMPTPFSSLLIRPIRAPALPRVLKFLAARSG